MSTAYPTALYTAVHTGNPGDLQFYIDACAGAGPVLELGCGSGRIAAALVASGHEVYGVDTDATALAAAADQSVNTVHADMRDFHIRRRFHRILIPYNGLYCLLSDADVIACLNTARRHLAPGGQLVFDTYNGDAIDQTAVALAAELGEASLGVVDASGQCWEVLESTLCEPANQLVTACYTYRPLNGDPSVQTEIRQRYLHSTQLLELLGEAGMMATSLHGDFNQAPFDAESEFMVVRAERW